MAYDISITTPAAATPPAVTSVSQTFQAEGACEVGEDTGAKVQCRLTYPDTTVYTFASIPVSGTTWAFPFSMAPLSADHGGTASLRATLLDLDGIVAADAAVPVDVI